MPTEEQWLDTRTLANVQSADAFGSIEFVSADRVEVHAQFVDVDGDAPGSLHAVAVHNGLCLVGDGRDLTDRLDGAEFIVGVHDADEHGVRTQCVPDIVGIHDPGRMPSAVNVQCSATIVAVRSARIAEPNAQLRTMPMRSVMRASGRTGESATGGLPGSDIDKRYIVYR